MEKVTALESMKIDGLSYLESVMTVEASEKNMKLKIADMTAVQIQRAFRARLRHEITAIRKDRKNALKLELERITAEHMLSASHSVNFARELQHKIDQRKLAEVDLLDAQIESQTADNAQRMSKALAKKFDFASIVGKATAKETV